MMWNSVRALEKSAFSTSSARLDVCIWVTFNQFSVVINGKILPDFNVPEL